MKFRFKYIKILDFKKRINFKIQIKNYLYKKNNLFI